MKSKWDSEFNKEEFLSAKYLVVDYGNMRTDFSQTISLVYGDTIGVIQLRCLPTLELITLFTYVRRSGDYRHPLSLNRTVGFDFYVSLNRYSSVKLSSLLVDKLYFDNGITFEELDEVVVNYDFFNRKGFSSIEFKELNKFNVSIGDISIMYNYDMSQRRFILLLKFGNFDNNANSIVLTRVEDSVCINNTKFTALVDFFSNFRFKDFYYDDKKKCYSIKVGGSVEVDVFLDSSIKCLYKVSSTEVVIDTKLMPYDTVLVPVMQDMFLR